MKTLALLERVAIYDGACEGAGEPRRDGRDKWGTRAQGLTIRAITARRRRRFFHLHWEEENVIPNAMGKACCALRVRAKVIL